MKMSKRIFIVVLMLALVVSGLAFASSAAVEVTVDNYDAVLEYYECPVLLNYDFSDPDTQYSDALIVYEAQKKTASSLEHFIVTDADAPGGKYLNLAVSPAIPSGSDNVYLNWNVSDDIGEVESFFLNATVSGTKLASGTFKYNPVVQIVVDNNVADPADAQTIHEKGTVIATIDFRGGALSYLSVDSEGNQVMKSVDKTEFTVSANSWYEIVLAYNGETGACTISLTDVADPNNSVEVLDACAPYEALKSIRLGVQGTYKGYQSGGNVVKISNLSIAQGSFIRDIANSQTDIENRLLGALSLYEASDSEEFKIDVLKVIDKVFGYGFVTENSELISKIDSIADERLSLYSAKLAAAVAAHAELNDYYSKRANVDEHIIFANSLKTSDLSSLTEEEQATVLANIDFILDVDAELVAREADSEAFISAMAGFEDVAYSNDYASLKSYYEAVKDLSPDATYEGVSEYYGYLDFLIESVEDMESRAETFISAVEIASNSRVDFVTRYENYLIAKEDVFDNETYPGITEALAAYNTSVAPYMEQHYTLANNFITYVAKADYSIYISAKQENLDLAAQYKDICHSEFPGVAEAKVLYDEILAYIAEQKVKANAYISAVNALDGLTGDALKAGIERAQELQKDGNVLGVDGVNEANIKLNKIVSEMELYYRYCEHFISLVNSISNVTVAAEKYNLLLEAKAAEPYADSKYPGVAESSETLRKAINAFNIQVDFVNASFEQASEAAVTLSGAGKTANTVSGHVIAIVKKIFDEE